MRLLRNIALIFFTIAAVSSAEAQRCGTALIHEQRLQTDTAYARQHAAFLKAMHTAAIARKTSGILYPDTVYNIPVVVHIVHNNASGAVGGPNNINLSDEQIRSQIRILNEDYRRKNADTSLTRSMFKPVAADAKFQFCLANRDPQGNFTNGITRTYHNKAYYDVNTVDEIILKGLIHWPSDQYLNIWVARLETAGNTIGYTTYPTGSGLPGISSYSVYDSLDGAIVDYRAFGDTGTVYVHYNKGRTTTHEIGHFFGLIHIWGDSHCGDDYCADTPTDAAQNQTTQCLDSSNCTGPYTTDMTENYMDYSPDVCMNMFTLDQVWRMRTAIQVSPRRKALLKSLGCCGEGNPESYALPFFEGFESPGFVNTWTISNPDSAATWTVTVPGAQSSSASSIFIKNDSVYTSSGSGQKFYDLLTSTYLSFANSGDPVLEFDLAYANNTVAQTDSLVVSYSILCDTVWKPLLSLSGSQLATTSRVQNSFIPGDDEWKRYRIPLSALTEKRFVRIRFEDYSNGGNYLYLDNINIYKNSDHLIVNVYPNPAREIATIEIIFKDRQNAAIELFDPLGRIIFKKQVIDSVSFAGEINVTTVPDGIYFLRVISEGQHKVNKIKIEH